MRWKPLCLLPCMAAVTACGGSPASVADATEKIREAFDKDDHEVTWLNVTKMDEPGKFLAIVDRVTKGDPATEETLICNASVMSNSSSWTCQTAKPSIMIQAAEMLKKNYQSRKIAVPEYNLRRTGEGNNFAGYFVLVSPDGRQRIRIPCRGTEEGTDFNIDCDQAYGNDGNSASDQPAPGNDT